MPGLLGEDDLRELADAALETPGADGIEVLVVHEWGGLTRFARSAIHQNTFREDTGVRVRAVRQNRVGVAATNDLSKSDPDRVRGLSARWQVWAERCDVLPLRPYAMEQKKKNE